MHLHNSNRKPKYNLHTYITHSHNTPHTYTQLTRANTLSTPSQHKNSHITQAHTAHKANTRSLCVCVVLCCVVCVWLCVWLFVRTCLRARVYLCVSVCMRLRVRVFVSVCISVRVCIYAVPCECAVCCVCVCVCVCSTVCVTVCVTACVRARLSRCVCALSVHVYVCLVSVLCFGCMFLCVSSLCVFLSALMCLSVMLWTVAKGEGAFLCFCFYWMPCKNITLYTECVAKEQTVHSIFSGSRALQAFAFGLQLL